MELRENASNNWKILNIVLLHWTQSKRNILHSFHVIVVVEKDDGVVVHSSVFQHQPLIVEVALSSLDLSLY